MVGLTFSASGNFRSSSVTFPVLTVSWIVTGGSRALSSHINELVSEDEARRLMDDKQANFPNVARCLDKYRVS